MRNLPAQTTEYGPGGSQSVLEQLLARIASGDPGGAGTAVPPNPERCVCPDAVLHQERSGR